MLARERGPKLEDAAGIAGGDNIRFELGNEFGFAGAKGVGGVGLHEIVDSRGATADGGFRDLSKLEARNAREQSAWLRADPLRVL